MTKNTRGTTSNVGDPKKEEDKKVEPKKEEAKVEPKLKLTPEFVKAKIEKIKASKMPAWQKEKCIKALMPKLVEEGNLISFAVYVRLKAISTDVSEAMKSYPSARGKLRATMEQWDEIYKKF